MELGRAIDRVVGQHRQRVARIRSRQVVERGARRIRIVVRACARSVQRVGGVDRGEHVVERVEAACADRLAEHRGLRRRAAFDRDDQRQGRLALGEVVADVLAERAGVGRVVEHVVGDLERKPEIEAVARERVFLLRRQPGQHRAEPRRCREQHRGLALDHVQVGLLAGVRISDVEQLQHLALGDAVGGIGEDAHDAHVVQFHHHLERTRVQEIADQNAGRIAPHRVRGLAAAAQVRFVDHVVVQQGRGVDELDQRGELDVMAAAVAGRVRRDQVQHRPQALAAAADDVFGDLVDQHHVGGESRTDQRVDRGPVGGGQRLHVGEARDAGGGGGQRAGGSQGGAHPGSEAAIIAIARRLPAPAAMPPGACRNALTARRGAG